MSDTTVTDLTYIYFLVTKEVDKGKEADIEDAQDAMMGGRTIDFLRDHVEPSANLDLDHLNETELNDMFERYCVTDPNDLGIQNNGLLYIASNIVEILQNGDWADEYGQEVEMPEVYLEAIR